MRKKIRFFRQHTMETCGASCVLMILDLYRKVQYPTEKQERKLYEIYRSRAFCGMPGAAIACCLSLNDLDVRLIHSSEQMLENRDGYFDAGLYEKLREEYSVLLSLCDQTVDVRNGVDITCEFLKRELAEGRQLILECIVPGNADGIHEETLHWIVVYGYADGEFLACDPLCSKIRLTEEEITHYMDTPVGKILVSVGELTASGEEFDPEEAQMRYQRSEKRKGEMMRMINRYLERIL